MKRILLISCSCLLASLFLLWASDPGIGDWPMWGGTPDRNMVSKMKGLPTSWDVKAGKNVKWIGQLGSQAYGNPVDKSTSAPITSCCAIPKRAATAAF
jgi:hypothetical protein